MAQAPKKPGKKIKAETLAADRDSSLSLELLSSQHQSLENRFSEIKTVLLIFSTRAIAFDRDALREKVLEAYPAAELYFQDALNKPLGKVAPKHVDLLLDLVGSGQRESYFAARRNRRKARYVVGRSAGVKAFWQPFRQKAYDRLVDESKLSLPASLLEKERLVQREVLALAGVPMSQSSPPRLDESKTIARSRRAI